MNDLSTFTSAELWLELRKRFRSCVFLGERQLKVGDESTIDVAYHSGALIHCLGLLANGQRKIMEAMREWVDTDVDASEEMDDGNPQAG